MKFCRIRTRSFLLIVLSFSAVKLLFLNMLSSIPTEEAAAPLLSGGAGASRSTGHLSDELQWDINNTPNDVKPAPPWLANLYPIGHSLLKRLPNIFMIRRLFQERPKCRILRLWPSGLNDTEDRILNQLNYSLPRSSQNDSKAHLPKKSPTPDELKNSELKTILSYTGLGHTKRGQQQFLDDNCPVNTCYITDNHSYGPMAKAVLFQNRMSKPSFTRPPDQVWILFLLESPLNTQSFGSLKNLVNMTATYRRDSTIVAPYERFVPYENASQYHLVPPKRNYASGKTKNVAWFVSNCGGRNNRMDYALELSKHIDVDIYGPCGKLRCPRSESKKCFDKLNTDYKFYLAFENSNCKDYITEKLFWNGLWNNVVPVVMGASPEDYKKAAPPHSYIHVDDFDSPKDLAQYLKKLNQNDDLYNDYFRWKGSGSFLNTKFYCRLCAMIHDNSRLSWYEDIDNWWRGPGICVTPSTGNKYASWRKTQFSYHNITDSLLSANYAPRSINLPANISSSIPSGQVC